MVEFLVLCLRLAFVIGVFCLGWTLIKIYFKRPQPTIQVTTFVDSARIELQSAKALVKKQEMTEMQAAEALAKKKEQGNRIALCIQLISGKYRTDTFTPTKRFIYSTKRRFHSKYIVNGLYFSNSEDMLVFFSVDFEGKVPKSHTKHDICLSNIVSCRQEVHASTTRYPDTGDVTFNVNDLGLSILTTSGSRIKVQMAFKMGVNFTRKQLLDGRRFGDSDIMQELNRFSDALTARLAVYARKRGINAVVVEAHK